MGISATETFNDPHHFGHLSIIDGQLSLFINPNIVGGVTEMGRAMLQIALICAEKSGVKSWNVKIRNFSS
jgi:hypothetical protein